MQYQVNVFFFKKNNNQAVVKAVKTFQLEHCKRRRDLRIDLDSILNTAWETWEFIAKEQSGDQWMENY